MGAGRHGRARPPDQLPNERFQHPAEWETPLHDGVRPTLDPLVRADDNDRFSAAVGCVTIEGRIDL